MPQPVLITYQTLYFFRTGLGETPLELCVERELPGVIEVLCRKGADLCSSSSGKGDNPPLWKALQKNEDIASILVRYDPSERSELRYGVRGG